VFSLLTGGVDPDSREDRRVDLDPAGVLTVVSAQVIAILRAPVRRVVREQVDGVAVQEKVDCQATFE
jgi:hypothetical protein